MARLKILQAAGALLISIALTAGCSSPPAKQDAPVAQQAKSATQDRTPRWMKYRTSSSRIPRPTDGNGRPISADMVLSTDSEGLYQLPSVTVQPCAKSRSGC